MSLVQELYGGKTFYRVVMAVFFAGSGKPDIIVSYWKYVG